MQDLQHLIDREREKASIEGLLTDAGSGTGRLLTVCGAAGTGKTALVDHAADLATRHDMTVLRVRGSFAEVEAPFGLAQRLFEPRLELGALSREELNGALAGLAAAGPVLMAVDDVQWADEPSLRWLASLPPRIEHHGIAMLVSVCAGDPPTDPELLDDLLESSSAELRPAELGPAAAAVLLGGDPARASTCWELTAGNPALLTRLAAELSTEDSDPLEVEVPLVARTVHVWLRRVSDQAVAIARAVAVLGAHATLDRVADITGVELPEVADVVAAVERKGLLRTAHGTVEFAQPLVRATVTRELSFAALRRVHGQAARLLHESGAPDETIAEHLLAAGPATSAWAVGVLRSAAASALERGCPELAVTWLRHAAAGQDSVDVLVDLARAEAHVDVPSALGHLGAAEQRGADVTGELARLRVVAGDRPDETDCPATRMVWLGHTADDAAASAERVLSAPPTPADAPDLLRAVDVLTWAGRLDEALHHANLVIAMAQRAQHLPALGAAHSTRSVVVRHLGRLDAAVQDARTAVDLLTRCGAATADAVLTQADVLIELGDHEECAELLITLPDTWVARLASGRLRAATGLAGSAVDDLLECGKLLAHQDIDNPAVAPWRSEAALVLHRTGRTADAVALARDEVDRARQWGVPGPLARALRAVAVVVRGPLGLALLEEAVSVVDDTPHRLERAKSLIAYGTAQRRANRLTAARRTLHDAVDLAAECASPLLVDRAKTELLTAGGRLREVIKSGPESLTAAEYRVATIAAYSDKSTKQIAEQLYVTRRTIEIHLANATRKLGVRDRRELRAALPRKAVPA